MKFSTYERSTALIKSRLEKIKKAVLDIAATNEPPTPVQVRSLATYYGEIKKKRDDFELNLHRVLDSVSTEEASDQALSNDQDTINELYVEISSIIDTLNPNEVPKSPSADSVAGSGQFQAPAHIRLPKLELKTFDGTPSQWVSFVNLFDTTVHRNSGISNVAKFQYLLSVLTSEPLNLVRSLNITSANYLVAYNLLRDRYHNIRRLTTLHLNQILDLPNISATSVKLLRNFINLFYEHSQALIALDCDISTQSNPLLSALLLRKLDQELRQKLEVYRSSHSDSQDEPAALHSLPAVQDIIRFLNTECAQVEDASLHNSASTYKSQGASSSSYNQRSKPTKRVNLSSDVSMLATQGTKQDVNSHLSPPCFTCKQSGHKIYGCASFKGKTPNERYQVVKENHRCVSCLGNHNVKNCQSQLTCGKCHKRHHTLLHFEKNLDNSSHSLKASIDQPKARTIDLSTPPNSVACLGSHEKDNPSSSARGTTVLLGTSLVKLTALNGNTHVFRALLDSGSMIDCISERAAQLLGTSRNKSTHTIRGISATCSQTKGYAQLSLASLSDHIIAPQHSFHVLDRISIEIPRSRLSPEVFELVKPYVLADPTFHLPGGIDVLLGGSLFPQLLTHQSHSLGPNLPYAVGTKFGYIIMGTAPCLNDQSPVSCLSSLLSTTDHDIHTTLQKFWQLEEPPTYSKTSEEEKQCDDHYTSTHSRLPDGRYMVHLPFKKVPPALGSSQGTADRRFRALESKLTKSPELRQLYSQDMAQHISEGHMVHMQDFDPKLSHYFLPHHAIIKDSSSSTKLRVVYDASSKSSSGFSLNDMLMTGPKLQTNICDVLLNFRKHNIVFTCDIRQMYLQILIHPSHQPFQLVLWRNSPSEELSIYKLTRVTFGVSSSPYLAIRTLHQLANDEGISFPEAAQILKSQTYVDDIISGANTVAEALKLQNQLMNILKRGGFELRKWASNSPQLLQDLPQEHLESPVFLETSNQPHITVLGLHWSPSTDHFTYKLNFPQEAPTKRTVLSFIAKIYDPCGFLAPCIMLAKCFMQVLWAKGLTWDELLPHDLADKWQKFVSHAQEISNIQIPRALHLDSNRTIELHGFSDASERGYAAAVYLKCQSTSYDVTIRLLLSKTRVAPLKRVTLPRLELCAAHLLAQIVTYCLSIFKLPLNQCHLWCDSSVVLTWLQTPSYRLKTYVANRVSQCQEMIPTQCWRHISSAENPADCASRGLLASQLVKHPLWWSGPEWLKLPLPEWPTSLFNPVDLSTSEEMKATPLAVLTATKREEWSLLSQYSMWTRLLYVMAYTLRFIFNCRHSDKRRGPLTTIELNSARLQIFKVVQQATFVEDLKSLNQEENPSCSSRLKRLNPFLDDHGLIRVGGRLSHAPLSQEGQHPVILPKRHHVVNLLINYYHTTHLHAGPQLTQSLLSQFVWILSARCAIRAQIYKCIKCFKLRPRNTNPLMGDLPSSRVTPARAFLSTGVDYAGPFNIKFLNLRAIRHVKVYMCVFICMVTKAVHLEVVTDLTADSFIATLTRFVSRRGLCSDIFSDCGTNFIGANTILQKLIKENIFSPQGQKKIHHFTSMKGINFHFNPPSAPHQGGLWEAAVKSAKYHLRRVMGDTILTLMEFTTLLSQVEAMLNSRPLTPLSKDPSELEVLTPGHFLIGCPLAAVPERDHLQLPNNRLKQWHLVQALQQRIWNKWMREYLHTLQQRSKWCQPTKNLQVDDLVLVHCDTPPLAWPLARILAVHPGSDGIVRSVDLKTKSGFLTRPAVKVFKLPLH